MSFVRFAALSFIVVSTLPVVACYGYAFVESVCVVHVFLLIVVSCFLLVGSGSLLLGWLFLCVLCDVAGGLFIARRWVFIVCVFSTVGRVLHVVVS